jgi:hypothetical protein
MMSQHETHGVRLLQRLAGAGSAAAAAAAVGGGAVGAGSTAAADGEEFVDLIGGDNDGAKMIEAGAVQAAEQLQASLAGGDGCAAGTEQCRVGRVAVSMGAAAAVRVGS